MERGVAAPSYLVMRYVRTFWSAGEKYIEFEPIVTPEMAERMRRDNESEASGQTRPTGRSAVQEVRSAAVETLPARSVHRPGKL